MMTKSEPDFPLSAIPERMRVLIRHLQLSSYCPLSVIFAHLMFAIASIAQRTCYVKHGLDNIIRPQLFFIELDNRRYSSGRLDLRQSLFKILYRIEKSEQKRSAHHLHKDLGLYVLRSCKDPRFKKWKQVNDVSVSVMDDGIGIEPKRVDLKILDDRSPLWGGRDTFISVDTRDISKWITLSSNAKKPIGLHYYQGKVSFSSSGCFYITADSESMAKCLEENTRTAGSLFFDRSIFVEPSKENVLVRLVDIDSPGEEYSQLLDLLLPRCLASVGDDPILNFDSDRWDELVKIVFRDFERFARVLKHPNFSSYLDYQKTNALKIAICLHTGEMALKDLNSPTFSNRISYEILNSALILQHWFVERYLLAFVPEYACFLDIPAHIDALDQYLLKRVQEKSDDQEWIRYDEWRQYHVFKIAKRDILRKGPYKQRSSKVHEFLIDFLCQQGWMHVVKADGGKHWCYVAIHTVDGIVKNDAGPIVAGSRWNGFQPF